MRLDQVEVSDPALPLLNIMLLQIWPFSRNFRLVETSRISALIYINNCPKFRWVPLLARFQQTFLFVKFKITFKK